MGYNNGYYDGYEDGLKDARKKGGNAPAPEPEPMLVGRVAIQCTGSFSPNSETFEGNEVGGAAFLTELYMPYLKELPSNVLAYKSYLETVDLPACKKIGDYAIMGSGEYAGPSYHMETVNLPECEEVGSHAFESSSLPIVVELPKCKKLGVNAFACLRNMVGMVNLPECTDIGDNAFNGLGSRTAVGLDLSSIDIATVMSRACYWGLGCATIKCSDGTIQI